MIRGLSILGLIPARGGSKGVPRKNLRYVGGRPLIAWTISEARQSRYIDRLVISSEDPEIMSVGAAWGCDVPFQRPAEFAADTSPGIAPVLHALTMLPGYDFVVLLQPTSPLRNSADIDSCIEYCLLSEANACVSITKCTEHPFLMFRRSASGRLQRLVPEADTVCRRQDYPDVFLINGALYVASTSWLEKTGTFFTDETVGFEMPPERSLDIDFEEDFDTLEVALRGRTVGCSVADGRIAE